MVYRRIKLLFNLAFPRMFVTFACKLLESVHVAVVPGVTYGQSCDNYVRIAFTKNVDVIKQGVERIATFMSQF